MMIFTIKSLYNLLPVKLILKNPLRSCSCNGKIRVRFAPSPTGYLHLGGLRTALYNYIFAKKYNGTFILRIEDTDQSRKVEGAIQALQNDLLWSGIQIDEGPQQGGFSGSYVQSERLEIYRNQVETLLNNGTAYRCFCTDKRLKLLKREAVKAQEIPKYDNKCRHLTEEEINKRLNNEESYCVRFKISDKEEKFEDLIYGPISYNISLNEGDPVIIKTDKFPTYHFANVIDDHLMEISHVLRGVEWQISTTKHLLLYKAFGWKPPNYGHLPLLMNADGTKLSKRQGDIRIRSFQENGIFPLALLNFIINSGGGFNKDLERHLKPKIYTVEELSQQFDLTNINTHSGKLMSERLEEFNRLELKRQINCTKLKAELIQKVRNSARKHYPEYTDELNDEYIEHLLKWSVNRINNLEELFSKNFEFLWHNPCTFSLDTKLDENLISALRILKENLNNKVEINLQREDLNLLLKEISKMHNINYSIFMKSLRGILSGLKEGPSIAEMIEILGKEITIKRLDLSLNKSNC